MKKLECVDVNYFCRKWCVNSNKGMKGFAKHSLSLLIELLRLSYWLHTLSSIVHVSQWKEIIKKNYFCHDQILEVLFLFFLSFLLQIACYILYVLVFINAMMFSLFLSPIDGITPPNLWIHLQAMARYARREVSCLSLTGWLPFFLSFLFNIFITCTILISWG